MELMNLPASLQTTLIPANAAKFLGSRDSIILAGNGPSTSVQLFKSESVSGPGTEFRLCGKVDLNDVCTTMEICYNNSGSHDSIGRRNAMQAYLAVATNNKKGGINQNKSAITLVRVNDHDYDDDDGQLFREEDRGKHMLEPVKAYVGNDLGFQTCSTTTTFTSLSFDYGRSGAALLAIGTDRGEVSVFDLLQERVEYKFNADACGLNKVVFAVGGQLITLGQSSHSQLRLWDLRSALPSLSLKHPPLPGGEVVSYSCISADLISQQKILCGTDTGAIVLWDLRKGAAEMTMSSPTCSKVHADKVSGLMAVPAVDVFGGVGVISSSFDGTVKGSVLPRHVDEGREREGEGEGRNADVLKQYLYDHAPIIGLDRIADYRVGDCMLATSSIGGLWRIQL